MPAESQPSGSRIRRFFDTIRRRRGNQNENHTDKPTEPPPLPYLPAQRPRPLTPTKSPSQDLVATLGTLATLPSELRRLVLIAAFGERTLRLDLRLCRPRRANCLHLLERSVNKGHGLGSAPLGDYAYPDYAAPPAWRWYGCVCHRVLPPSVCDAYVYPHSDECLRGRAHCEYWSWECHIGVMGWLLACRQTYAEGIDVLYSTNTFFLESTALFDALFCPAPHHAHQLLLPQRLASITSLELRWELLLWGKITHSRDYPWTSDPLTPLFADKGRAQLAVHLRYLGEAFPNLRTLVLTFTDSLYHDAQVRPVWALDEINRLLLRPITDAVARLQHLQRQRVLVELPSNVFDDLNGVQDPKDSPSLGLEVEKRMKIYPLSGATVHSDGVGSEPVEAAASDQVDQGRFYYIKRALTSELTWTTHNGPGQYQEDYRYIVCRAF